MEAPHPWAPRAGTPKPPHCTPIHTVSRTSLLALPPEGTEGPPPPAPCPAPTGPWWGSPAAFPTPPPDQTGVGTGDTESPPFLAMAAKENSLGGAGGGAPGQPTRLSPGSCVSLGSPNNWPPGAAQPWQARGPALRPFRVWRSSPRAGPSAASPRPHPLAVGPRIREQLIGQCPSSRVPCCICSVQPAPASPPSIPEPLAAQATPEP